MIQRVERRQCTDRLIHAAGYWIGCRIRGKDEPELNVESASGQYRVGIDIGGTFTDVVIGIPRRVDLFD